MVIVIQIRVPNFTEVLKLDLVDNHRNTIHIEINDNGCGMDTTTLDRIYDPFFTTKPVGRGTGLGMTVCRDIVRAHQGTIEVTSEPGQGSRVSIELPITQEKESVNSEMYNHI